MRIEHWFYSIPLRLRSLFHRARVERDLDDELQYHLERQTEQFIAAGLKPVQARRAALRALGGLSQHKEECRDARGLNTIENISRDLRFAVRVLARSPGFAIVATLTLALAIGANSVVFSVINSFLLRPLDVPQTESVYGIEHANEHSMYESYPDYRDLSGRNRTFDGIAGFTIDEVGFDTGDTVSLTWVESVTANYFDVLRLQPYLGRFFHASEDRGPGSAPYAVLNYHFWHAHLHDDPAVIGRVVRINKHPFTIIGIAPPSHNGMLVFGACQLFVPIVDQEQLEGSYTLDQRRTQSVFMTFGRLKPGITPAEAAADLDSIGSYLAKTYPNEHGATAFTLVRPGLYGNYMGGPIRAFLAGLALLAGLILLAACANLGSLFAARAADRSRELALRLALGATRLRIVRQLLTEAVLIALAGGALGLWGSILLIAQLANWHPFPRFPIDVPIVPDARVYVVALLLALASGLLFGLVPVRQVLRANPYQVVKAGPGGAVWRRVTARDLLLAAQIAICAVLVTSSMVAVRGLVRSLHSDFGFEPRHAMLVSTDLAMANYRADRVPGMQKAALDAVAAIPGVESAGITGRTPLAGGGFGASIFDDDTSDFRLANAITSSYRFNISPGYLRAAGTRLLAGRDFSWHDDAASPRVVILNAQLARKLYGSPERALGGRFRIRDGTRLQVVGVVENGKYMSLTEDPECAIYLPILQAPMSETWLVIRSRRDPAQLAAAIRGALRKLDPGLPAFIQTWNQQLNLALFPARIATASLGILGFMGAMLSLTGIFGMAAYTVSKRMRELGIRIAIGAQPKQVLRAALGRSLKLLALGSAAGLILGILSGRVLAAIVYQANARDPLVLIGAILAMSLLGLVATSIPARRALSLDPATLLREE